MVHITYTAFRFDLKVELNLLNVIMKLLYFYFSVMYIHSKCGHCLHKIYSWCWTIIIDYPFHSGRKHKSQCLLHWDCNGNNKIICDEVSIK